MASKKPSGLGRGLGALLGDDVLKTETAGALYLPISEVESNSSQPRKNFDEEALAQLADSIRDLTATFARCAPRRVKEAVKDTKEKDPA